MITNIYALTNENGKIRYIGKTSKSLRFRFYHHLWDAKSGERGHRSSWIRLMLSRGLLPTIQLIGEVEGDGSREEIAWIKYFREEGVRLTNETDGGEGCCGHIYSTEQRLEMSEARKGHFVSQETRAKLSKAHKGRTFSKETLAKMSMAKKGRILPQKTREALMRHLLGHSVSAETRKKIGQANHKRIISAKTCEKIRRVRLGSHSSVETRRKVSNSLKGRPVSDETRQKISNAIKKIWFLRKNNLKDARNNKAGVVSPAKQGG